MPKARILVADDNLLVFDGLRSILGNAYDLVGPSLNGRQAVADYLRLRPDVLLLEIELPHLNGIDVARRLTRQGSGARIVFLTMQSYRAFVEAAFQSGASGYVWKEAAAGELPAALSAVLRGGHYISPHLRMKIEDVGFQDSGLSAGTDLSLRQLQILQLVGEHKTMRQIAGVLGISVRTVEFHKAALMDRLGLGTKAELVRYAQGPGI